MSLRRTLLSAALFVAVFIAGRPLEAGISNVTLSNTTIPFETGGIPNGTTITIILDGSAGGAVQLDIHKLVNISDGPTPENQIAGIVFPGLAPGSSTPYFWNALWLLGGDVGRQNGSYLVRVTQGSSIFTVPSLIQITSVDIHNVSATPSFDAGGSPAFPYLIRYALAKACRVTVQIRDSNALVVRTLVNDVPQQGEDLGTVALAWDGLADDGRPVPLGIYTVNITARDPANGDIAIPRSRTIAVQSLANLNTNLQELFDNNTFVYPNPVRNGQATFQSLAVRNNAAIFLKIYTLAGDLVYERSFPNLSTAQIVEFTWNATNQAGKKLGRGLYYFVVRQEDPEGVVQTIKKVAVIP